MIGLLGSNGKFLNQLQTDFSTVGYLPYKNNALELEPDESPEGLEF